MSSTNLLFQKLQPVSTALRFGETYTPPVVYLTATAHAALDLDIVPHLATATGYHASMAVAVDFEISAKITTAHDNRVNRAPHLTVAAPWQSAAARRGDIALTHRRAAHRETSISSSLAAARPLPFSTRAAWLQAGRRPLESVLAWTSASRVGATLSTPWRSLRPHQPTIVMPWSIGAIVTRTIASAWQDRQRHPRPELRILWGAGQPISLRLVAGHQVAQPLPVGVRIPWQAAHHPPPGISIPISIGPPIPPPCYTPSATLRFWELASTADPALRFHCPNWTPPTGSTIIVPVRTVYMQTNTVTLVLASNGQPIKAANVSLALDVDSWVWSWSASVPANYLTTLQAEYGSAVEVIATINGTAFNLFVERIQRDRQFNNSTLAVSGRGRAAWLAAPYALVETRGNTEGLTAQQLMAAALTINGVSNGWSLDWNITDWLVPAGVWSHTGTPMEACLTIAQAAGAYIQAHRTDNVLRVLPRYVDVPWNWGALTPDIILPENVCVTEGIEWQDKADYNAVYVSGEVDGVLAQVKRTGTDGGKVAPMVVDPLITHADAARQRGIAVLSATGRSKVLTLQLPVLPETGIIVPGKVLKYQENGVDHIGISRAVQVSANFPKVRQSVTVESHVV